MRISDWSSDVCSSDLDNKCFTCHKPIAADIAARTHFHGKYAPARTQICKSCHTEHQGRALKLIQLDRKTFDHRLAEFQLTGAHARTSCTGCYGPGDSHYRGTPGNRKGVGSGKGLAARVALGGARCREKKTKLIT